MEFEVYLTEEVIDFIVTLPVKMQAKVQRTIELLENFGYQLPEPHSKKIVNSDNLYELRVKHGSDICRLFYFHYMNKIYVVTSGYVKKNQKTDKNEIGKATLIKKRFLEENNV